MLAASPSRLLITSCSPVIIFLQKDAPDTSFQKPLQSRQLSSKNLLSSITSIGIRQLHQNFLRIHSFRNLQTGQVINFASFMVKQIQPFSIIRIGVFARIKRSVQKTFRPLLLTILIRMTPNSSNLLHNIRYHGEASRQKKTKSWLHLVHKMHYGLQPKYY